MWELSAGGALIRATVRAEAGENFGLGQSWQDGLAKAVPLGLFQLVLYLPLLLLLALFFIYFFIELWPSISAITLPRGTPRLPPGFQQTIFSFIAAIFSFICCFALFQLFIGVFTIFGSRAIVLEDQGGWQAFSRGWQRFRHNFGPTIILAIILFLLTMFVGLALAIPTATIMLPVMMFAMPQLFSESGPPIGTLILLGGVTLLVVLIFTFINGVFRVFIETLWTLAYRAFMLR